MTNEKLIMELINKKDDTELMNMINTITFPFTDKYRVYTEKKKISDIDVQDIENGFGHFAD